MAGPVEASCRPHAGQTTLDVGITWRQRGHGAMPGGYDCAKLASLYATPNRIIDGCNTVPV